MMETVLLGVLGSVLIVSVAYLVWLVVFGLAGRKLYRRCFRELELAEWANARHDFDQARIHLDVAKDRGEYAKLAYDVATNPLKMLGRVYCGQDVYDHSDDVRFVLTEKGREAVGV